MRPAQRRAKRIAGPAASSPRVTADFFVRLRTLMLAPTIEPTVASVFAPRTTIDADGTVEGYASLFGEIDQARDMVMPGAFARDAAAARARAASRCCSSTTRPSRSASGSSCARTIAGCSRAAGSFPKWRAARELLSLLRAGAIDGLSIGFRTAKARIDPKTRVRKL